MLIRHSFCARLALFVGLLAVCVGGANAFPVTWTLNGVTFADGGTASGSFIYDADNNTFSTWSVSVAGGDTQTFPPVTYDNSTSSASYFTNAPTDIGALFTLNASNRGIRLPGTSALSDAGGTMAVNIAGGGAAECFNCSPFRQYTGGTLTGTAAPVITSASSASYLVGTPVNFVVTTTGSPVPTLTVTGTLPAGVTFTDNGNGTGTFAGTATPLGTYNLTITAANGVNPNAIQPFVLAIFAPVAPTPALGNPGLSVFILLLLAMAWMALSRREQTHNG
jgi:hypothetical protein